MQIRSATILSSKRLAVKALSIGQPWAELILRRRKPFEIRTWKTKYRGLLVIHASGKMDRASAEELGIHPEQMSRGAFVGWAMLQDVREFRKRDATLLKVKKGGDGSLFVKWWNCASQILDDTHPDVLLCSETPVQHNCLQKVS